MKRRLRRYGALAIVVALGGCEAVSGAFEEPGVDGPCTLALIVDGEQLTKPYRMPLYPIGSGRWVEQMVDFAGEGWAGNVSFTTTFPDGRVVEASVEGESLSDGLVTSLLNDEGMFHITFQDRRCRHEFDLLALRDD